MSNILRRTTELAMYVTLSYLNEGDTVVDATCGTGRDTVSLARAVGNTGRVYAFDIQHEAIVQTQERLKAQGLSNARLIENSFVDMGSFLPANSAAAVVFNLGYLPGGDHSITTAVDDTMEGLNCALRTIRPGGIVTVVMYDGHEEGAAEKQQLLSWAEKLDAREYHAAYNSFPNQKNHPPEILWITKNRATGD